ncbi:hypothetical protein ACMVR2_003495 [Yersinia enterocolitica]
MLSEEQKLQIKMSMNDKWHLVKLTHVWPDGHLINQMAHALIERNAELLSLREQLASQATYDGITAQEWVAHGRGLAEKLKQTEAQLNTSRATVGLYVEKLEALKKLPPVAEIVSKFGDPEAFGEREIKVLVDLSIIPYNTKLYTNAEREGH